MANFFNQFLKQIATGDNVRDYQHAARTFVDGLYRLGPKSTSLFHVFIDVNPTVYQQDSKNPSSLYEMGLLAKTAALPKFTIQNKTLNAYNRKNVVQERIQYDPVTLTFHDDSSNIIRNFWYGYYSYYYRDSDHSESLYHQPHKYVNRQEKKWGYSPNIPEAPNYINAIRIYSLHQKSFSSYILINPMITAFQHGQHTQGEFNVMEHSMTIAYEAVQYEYGPVSQGSVKGFNILHYDNTPSPLTPLGGGTQSILGPGGMVETAGSFVTNLQSGNFGAAGLTALRAGANWRNADLKVIASSELIQTTKNIIRGQNSQSSVFVPTQGSVADGLSKSVYGIPKTTPGVKVNNMNIQDALIPSINIGRINL